MTVVDDLRSAVEKLIQEKNKPVVVDDSKIRLEEVEKSLLEILDKIEPPLEKEHETVNNMAAVGTVESLPTEEPVKTPS